MTDALCELRHNGDGTSPLAETLAKNIESRLEELLATVNAAVSRVEKSGLVNLISKISLLKVQVIIFKLFTFYMLWFELIKLNSEWIVNLISVNTYTTVFVA